MVILTIGSLLYNVNRCFMPNRSVQERLLEFYREEKFQLPLSIYYRGLDNEIVRLTISSILNKAIFEVYSKIALGLVRRELMEIIKKSLGSYKSFDLSPEDMLFVQQYYRRIILIVEWDCDPQELADLI